MTPLAFCFSVHVTSHIPRPFYCSGSNLRLAPSARNVVHLESWPHCRLRSHKSISSPIKVSREYLDSPLIMSTWFWLLTDGQIWQFVIVLFCDVVIVLPLPFIWVCLNGACMAQGIKAYKGLIVWMLDSSLAEKKPKEQTPGSVKWRPLHACTHRTFYLCLCDCKR